MPQTDVDPTIQTRLDVAEMKGMLTMALQNHGERIVNLEGERDKLHTRLNEKGQRITVAEQQIMDLRGDVGVLTESQRQQFGRSLQTVVGLAAVGGFFVAVLNALGII